METFHNGIIAVSFILNIIGAVIILAGVITALYELLKNGALFREEAIKLNESVRIKLGSYLVLGLEFFIAGDVIKTIIIPTWESLGMLGAIVIIRTILSYFLTKDLRK